MGYNTAFIVVMVSDLEVTKLKRIAVFHMLPSGGGIKVLHQFTKHLSKRFTLSMHVPEGGHLQPAGSSVQETVYPFPMWKKPAGALKPAAPLFLVLRLLSFKKVCRDIAEIINDSADAALVHNAMPVAAPPILQYLEIPSLYFCFEHPRHLYEQDIIKRTNSAAAEFTLKPLAFLEKRMDLQSARAATQIVTFSKYMQNSIKSIYHRNASIVRPGIDSAFFHPAQQLETRENYVLSVGALWPYKGHKTAIKVLSLIPGRNRPEIRIIADREFPGYNAELVSLAESLSVNLSIHKSISDTVLVDMYQRARAVLCCQRREPYGLVPLEAMACGTPVLAIHEGGFVDNIVHGKTGYLFQGSPQAGAAILQQILSAPEASAAIKASGISFVEKARTITTGAHELEEILERL